MRIGVVGVNFFPERVGIGVYTYDMCRFFVEAGHEVSMITGFPFYPELRRAPRYTGRRYLTERIDGIAVHRCFIHVPRRWGVGGRIAHELSFAVSVVPRLLTVKADVFVVISPPFAAAVPSAMMVRARGIPLAVHAQDLQPDAAARLGMLPDGPVLRALYRAERYLYRSARLVSTLDESMRARIVEKGVPAQKVVVFPNWVDVPLGRSSDGGGRFRAEHGFDGQFLVVYSGSMGVKQGLELILEVAGLAAGDPRVRFVLIGDGGARDALEEGARQRRLANVSFLPLQPLDRFAGVVAASDLSLIPQRPEVRDLVVPSKVLRVMAGGSPIVAAAHPESGLARVLRQSGAGVVVPLSEAAVVWDMIQGLQANPERRRAMGERGRAYAAQHFERRTVLARYLGQLEAIMRQ
jgi:putative colanic acid biosynthesis glycosyltransferase WcaI